jgi:DNA-binding Lrp family transcriptional regulator
MDLAYCLVSVFCGERNGLRYLAEEIGKHKEILEINPVFGEYDLLLKLGSEDSDDIGDFIEKKLRYMRGVVGVQTFVVPPKLDEEYQRKFREARGQKPK